MTDKEGIANTKIMFIMVIASMLCVFIRNPPVHAKLMINGLAHLPQLQISG